MKYLLPLSLLLVVLISISGCQSLYQNDWTAVKEKNGIEFSLRPVIGSKIPEFKGVTRMEGNIQQMLNVLMDVKSYPNWVYQCESAQVIETIGYDQMYIYQVNTIPLLRSRDTILHGKIESNTSAKILRVHLNARSNYCASKDSAACAEINQSNYLRVTKSSGFFEVEQVADNQLQVTWQQHVEPGGILPAWLVKSQLDNLVINTLENLRSTMAAQN
jgi:hypothetical protein